MQKTVRIGTVGLGYGPPVHLFCSIGFGAGRLSVTGVEGPKRDGNAAGSCGQIIMSPWEIVDYAPGWNPETVTRFREVWDRWHLNDMRAGSPAQMAHLRAHPVEDRLHYFETARESLRAAGLQPDRGYVVRDKDGNPQPYSYGSAWLREEVPADVLDFLRSSLPDADITPAWV